MRVRHAVTLAVPVLFAFAALAAEAPKPAPSAPPANTAEGRMRNIQVLKNVPVDDLVPAMQFMAASLGVDCGFCHVPNEPQKDDKEEKRTARKMIAMTQAINREHFDGHQEVTCMSCHMGKTHPASAPPVATKSNYDPPAPKPAELPAASAVLVKYFQAVGGAEAIAKVATRVQTGKIIGYGVDPLPVDVMSKAPDKRVTVIHYPKGENITGFDGKNGWTSITTRPLKDMSAAEADAARVDASIMFGSDILRLFTELQVVSFDTIDGKQAIKIAGRNPGKPRVHLWFDEQSGLILRVVHYASTPLGPLPTQIDLADFRAVDGVTIPFRWTVSSPAITYKVQIDETKQNTTVEDTAFERPVPSATAGS